MIKIDIGMPEHCYECPCCCDVFSENSDSPITEFCNLLKREMEDNKPEDCPLIKEEDNAL